MQYKWPISNLIYERENGEVCPSAFCRDGSLNLLISPSAAPLPINPYQVEAAYLTAYKHDRALEKLLLIVKYRQSQHQKIIQDAAPACHGL